MTDVKLLEINANDILGLSVPLTKLISVISAGMGKIYEPWHIKRMGEAEAERAKVLGNVANNCSVAMKFNDSLVNIDNTASSARIQRTFDRMMFQELKKQDNLDAINGLAFEEMKRKSTVSEESVNLDWLNSFYGFAGNISDVQMQVIWGKVLAGEVEQPGKFSLRTLDILRKLTFKDAVAFQKILSLILKCPGNERKSYYDYFILCGSMYEKFGVEYVDIMRLTEAGLMSDNSVVSVSFVVRANSVEYVESHACDMIFRNTSDKDVKISRNAFLLTAAGKELFDIAMEAGVKDPGEPYYTNCVEVFLNPVLMLSEPNMKNISIEVVRKCN